MEQHPSQQTGENQSRPGPRFLILALVLVAAVLAAYGNALWHPFLYDDIQLVVKNPEIRSLDRIPAMLGFSEDGFTPRNRWTRDITFALEYALAGLNPRVFHATNLLLHAANALLLLVLIRRLTGDLWLGWWTAAFFALHPVNTEVVAHVSGRRGLLAALFSLAAVLALTRYLAQGRGREGASGALWLGLAGFSKQVGIMAAPAAVAVEGYRRYREGGLAALRPASAGRFWVRAAGLAVITLTLAGVLVFATDSAPGMQGMPSYYDSMGTPIGVAGRLHIAGQSVKLLLMPTQLTVDYSYDALGLTQGWSPRALVHIGLLAAWLGLGTFLIIRRSWAGLGFLWSILFFLPHAGFISWHEVFAERFLYLSSMGFALMLATGLMALAQAVPVRRWALAAGVLLLGAGLMMTATRSQEWSSARRLWNSAVAVHPGAARAHKALGDEYMVEVRTDLALESYRAARKILPAYREAALGEIAALAARREYAHALKELTAFSDRWPDDARAHNLKGFLLQGMGDDSGALQAYEAAVDVNPDFAEGYNNLGRMYVNLGDLETAVAMYKKAVLLDPSMATALQNLAVVYEHGYEDEAQAARYREMAEQATFKR